ncbi:hypothetical protein [Streptomyces sp. NPDC054794]
MSLVPPGITRLVFAVDIESFSARLHLEQIREQDRLALVMEHALANAGTEVFARQESGDGMLLILPEGIDQAWVVPRLLTGLREGLEVDNRGRSGSARLRMRASVGEGTVHVAKNGFASGAVIDVCRLLNSGPLKQALRDAPDRDLVTAVTEHTYEQVVQHHYPGLDPSHFRQVEINIPDKGFRRLAWIDAPVRDNPEAGKGGPGTGGRAPVPSGPAAVERGPVARLQSPATPDSPRRSPRHAAREALDVGVRLGEGVYLAKELMGHHGEAENRHEQHDSGPGRDLGHDPRHGSGHGSGHGPGLHDHGHEGAEQAVHVEDLHDTAGDDVDDDMDDDMDDVF